MLASVWDDPEDALIYECALSLKADAIISRNAADFQKGVIPIMTCQEFFEYMHKEHGFHYEELDKLFGIIPGTDKLIADEEKEEQSKG